MFTALTFNMQNGEPWVGPAAPPAAPDIEATAAFLRQAQADVLFLQEVEQGRDGGGQAQPPPYFEILRRLLPHPWSVFAYPPDSRDELPFGLGLAIFSRFPLHAWERVILPAVDVEFEFGGRRRPPSPRLLIWAEAEVERRRVQLLNTHLQACFMLGTSSDLHPTQRRLALEQLRAAGPLALMGGDFNTEPGDHLLEEFESAGFPPAQRQLPTWKRHPYCTDHLFYGRGLRMLECRVLPTDVSDHEAVWAKFDLAS